MKKPKENASPTFRILVLEDEALWRNAIVSMYREILPRVEIVEVATPQEAVTRLKAETFDVISADLNLRIPGMSGIGVLQFAAARRAATGAIVITGVHGAGDPSFEQYVENEDTYTAVRMSLQAKVKKFFPEGAFAIFTKDLSRPPQVTVEWIAKELKAVDLLRLGGPFPPYVVRVEEGEGLYAVPRVSIRPKLSDPTARSERFVINVGDLRLLYRLAPLHGLGTRKGNGDMRWWLTAEEVVEVYRDEAPEAEAHSLLYSARRRLEKLGIRYENLLTWVAETGLMMHPSIDVELPEHLSELRREWNAQTSRADWDEGRGLGGVRLDQEPSFGRPPDAFIDGDPDEDGD